MCNERDIFSINANNLSVVVAVRVSVIVVLAA